MSISRVLIAAPVIALMCASSALGKAWRGLVPLHSTRANVEALLGAPQPGSRNFYKTENETVVVAYADRPCAYGWQVPVDTVISVLVSPKDLKLADVKLEESKYEKRKGPDSENIYYYVNQNEGLNWTVDTARGIVTATEYYPSNKDAHLKCPLKTAPDVAPAAKPKSSPLPRSSKRSRARKQTTKHGVSDHVPPPATPAKATPSPQLSTRERVLAMEQLAPAYEYTCAMHPDVHEAQAGLCPRCGMVLVSVEPSVRGEYKLVVTAQPVKPRTGERVQLRFEISNPQTGKPAKDFLVTHEKLFHLFIVSQDLSEYQHIHPVLEADGTFSVETTLPRTGLYKLHADFFPSGGLPQIIHRELVTDGFTPSKSSSLPALTPDASLVKTIDGMKITLEPGAALVAGSLIPLTYSLTDAQTGEPVRDLEPYLGAWGHTLILNADQSEYLHTHPSEMLPSGGNAKVVRGGPNVEFKSMFPAAGHYRIWTQFQRAGKVTTVSFTVNVRS